VYWIALSGRERWGRDGNGDDNAVRREVLLSESLLEKKKRTPTRQHVENYWMQVPADRMEHRGDGAAVDWGREVRSQETGNIDGQGGGAGHSQVCGRGSA
jgi:hypothetical protein